MAKEEFIIKDSKIKYKGVFDLKLLYGNLKDWLMREKYSDPVEGGEIKYSERIKPSGKQIEILWTCSKSEEGGYFELQIDISFFINGLNEVDAEKDGRKIKLDNCELEMAFSSKFKRNARNQWDENSLMWRIYEKYFIKDKTEQFKIDLYKDTNKLMDEVKNFLNLYRF